MGHPMSQTPGAVGTATKARRRPLVINRYGRVADAPDPTRPRRACACCGAEFQPSKRRRMLCADCFVNASSVVENATLGSV